MQGLRTTSVLILDDCDADAMKIAKALAQRRIGAILVPGASDERRPSCSLDGIRVAVLDIDLGVGTGTSMQDKIRHTARTVNGLIDRGNGPYVAVIWTTNTNDYTEFQNALKNIACPPVRTVKLDKTAVLNLPADKAAEVILETIGKAIAAAPPLEFANFWEQVIQDATTDTIVSLALAEVPKGSEPRALAFLAALLRSEASKAALKSDVDSTRDLMVALNQVLFDRVEARSVRDESDGASSVAPVRAVALENTGKLTVVEKSQLNASLLFDNSVSRFGPGVLYTYEQIESLNIGGALPDKEKILGSTVEGGHIERARELPVVFLEVSAACDHQQAKIRTARFLAGVVFSASTFKRGNKKKKINPRNGAEYLRILDCVQVRGKEDFPADEVSFVWNAHYPVSVQACKITDRSPIGRFREPLLTDVRAWLGYQSGRPGYALVR